MVAANFRGPVPMAAHGRGSGKRRANRVPMTIRRFHGHPYVYMPQMGSKWPDCLPIILVLDMFLSDTMFSKPIEFKDMCYCLHP